MKKIILFSAALLCCLFVNAVDIKRYVKEGGTGNGLTWETATGDLEAVLNLASQVDHLDVVVGEGTFTGDFKIPENVSLMGQFSGEDGYRDFLLNTWLKGNIKLSGFLAYVAVLGSVDMANARMVEVSVSHSQSEYGVKVENYGGLDRSYLTNCSIINNNIGLLLRYGVAVLDDCTIENNRQDGIYGKKGHLQAQFTMIERNGGIGCHMASPDVSCHLYMCTLSKNEGGGFHGGSEHGMYSDSRQTLIKCSICNNRSQEAGSAIWASSSVNVYSSIIHGNISECADAAAIYCLFNSNKFVNCNITHNKGGVAFSKYFSNNSGGEVKPLLTNCLLWNNGEDFVNPFNCSYKLQTCAVQSGGSGIPELDAERGLIVLEADNVGTKPGGMYAALDSVSVPLPNSCLINKGTPLDEIESFDFRGGFIGALGGTDIGACEYQGEYRWVADAVKVKMFDCDYRLASTTYKGITYYSMIPVANEDPETKRITIDEATIYLGTKRNAYSNIAGTPFVAVYREGKVGEKAVCNILALDKARGLFRWNYVDYVTGRTRPVIKKHPSMKDYFQVTVNGQTYNTKVYN